jgi:hypothetical protein
LDVVVRQRTAILELFAGEDQTLLVGWDALFVLDLALDIVDCVRGLHLEGDGLAREGLDEAVGSELEIGVEVAGSKVRWESWGKLTSALLIEGLVSEDVNGFRGWSSRTYSSLWVIVRFRCLGKLLVWAPRSIFVHEKVPRLYCRNPNVA